MASSSSSSSSLLLLRPPPPPPSPPPYSAAFIHRNLHQIPSNFNLRSQSLTFKPLLSSFTTKALTESSSDSPNSLDSSPDPQSLLQELADSFNLPPDYFSQLPNDLRLDLNDAAFDLSNGPVVEQCGQELGMTLLNISRAWESADTSTSTALVNNIPPLVNSLTGNNKSGKPLGKRLASAGRRFQSMGQYGQGELQRISKAMISTGNLLSSTSVSEPTNEQSKDETRMFKFGELQVELTREKAYIGAAIGFVYGIISWQLSQGIQNTPESSFQFANENAAMIAQSLRGTILIAFYGSTVLSGFATLGLVLLSQQLKSGKK
ncbi:hypothetical protein OSB04_025564 [Centaurea solstitialis]|uniref:LOW protein: ammonium transporter 1-like protein n=1 Tax=Centaurea solstitialis TaxID=347529 RepID=A0AA38W1U9_9ASTR|nr:hypothetical protein OSB04_025564 [Centaurea solstitialis]